MISLVRNIVFMLGKRGELRNKDILLTPQLSSSVRMLKFLSSCVLLFKKLVNYSYILLRVSIDPRVKPEGDERRKNVPEGDNLYQVMPRLGTNRSGIFELDDKLNNRKIPGIFCDEKNRDDLNLRKTIFKQSSLQAVTRGQAIFELEKNKIGRSFDVFWRKRGMTSLKDWLGGMTVKNKCNRGMTINVVVFSLFLLFPNLSYSATVFLPDAQNEEVFNSLSTPPVVGIDSALCEEIGYTYYSSGTCPAYHKQDTCVFSDKYLKCDAEGWCLDNGYTTTSCSSPKILDAQCPNNLSLYKTCSCPSDYAYSCSGTGYSSGNGTVCDSKYTSCNCSTYYSWNGSACAHVHSYVCPSGYGASSSGMISPVSAAKVCQLSGCSSTSGACYKEGHTHSYSCTSGYSTSCSNGYSGAASKKCSCGATSGTCYKCKSAPACTPLSNETGCSCGTVSCSDGCGGTRKCCKSAPTCTGDTVLKGCSCVSCVWSGDVAATGSSYISEWIAMMCTPMGLTGSCKPSCYDGGDDYCYLNCDY